MKNLNWKGILIKKKKLNLRNNSISLSLINKSFFVHNGKTNKNIFITKTMIGHKFGEFYNTRKKFLYKFK